MDEVKLYRKNSLGVGTWRVWQHIENGSTGLVCIAHSIVEGGSEVTHVDPIKTNMSGRTLQQQIDLEMQSRVNRQLDKGYKRTREDALLGSTNQLGFVNPMLAQKVTDFRLTAQHFVDAYEQPKFDGHRALITKQGGEMMAYSRKGKPITTVPHILEAFDPVLQDGDTVDGELYIHGTALQTIGSLIKRQQPESRGLCYHWYDIVTKQPFGQRYKLMTELHASIVGPQVMLVPTTKVDKMSTVYELFRNRRAHGYEGSMLRLSITGYQDGTRASQLLKVKERHDGEATVLSGRPSSQGWAILTVDFGGKTFDISAPGDLPEKHRVMQNIDQYIGKPLTIEYACLTNDGIPFHAVAMRWREDV